VCDHAGRGCVDCLTVLHTACESLDARDSTGATALHAALRHGKIECAKFLVETAHISVLVRDNVGGTPAHHAAYHGQVTSLRWLHSFAETEPEVLSAAASDGGTPVHFAAAMGWLECLQFLVGKCGNPDIQDGKGV
jgi:ankyrin repeat protein